MTSSECELTCQTSSSEATPVNAEQEMDSTDQPDGHKDTAATEQNTPDSVNSKPNGTFEPGCLHRDTDLFYTDFDQSPGPEDVAGAPVEPMDLFYPDKEESMFLEPPDAETQSWPSVLSVSALKPAPASETQADQPSSLLGEDFSHGADWTQENDEVNACLFSCWWVWLRMGRPVDGSLGRAAGQFTNLVHIVQYLLVIHQLQLPAIGTGEMSQQSNVSPCDCCTLCKDACPKDKPTFWVGR